MMEGNPELTLIADLLVAASAKTCEAMIVVWVCIVELAPRNSDKIGPVGYVETPITTIIESTFFDDDIGYILL